MNEMKILERQDMPWGDRVALLAHAVQAMPGATVEQDDFDVRHMFKELWYVREFDLPASSIFIGRSHRLGHIVKLLSGRVVLVLEDHRLEYVAPAVIQTVPGFQTVCYALTDITAQSWHFNPEQYRDIERLEDEHFGSPTAVLERGETLANSQENVKWLAQLQLQ